MYCKKCRRYINGIKAKVKHKINHRCYGLDHIFKIKMNTDGKYDVIDKRERDKQNGGQNEER